MAAAIGSATFYALLLQQLLVYTAVLSPVHSLPIRINCGGAAYDEWSADAYFAGSRGSTTYRTYKHLAADPIYQSERWGSAVEYEIPVLYPGQYTVVLHFAEIWFSAPGQRVFNVDVEGTWIVGVDVVEESGAPFVAITRSETVRVEDGFVSIRFHPIPKLSVPKVSAIEVLRSSDLPIDAVALGNGSTTSLPSLWSGNPTIEFDPIRINCGSTVAYTDSHGQLWKADRSFTGKRTGTTTQDIVGTSEAALFQTNRWGEFSYEIPIPAGDYEVILWFAEVWFTQPSRRLFGLVVEGRVVPNIDIFGQAGASFTALSREVAVTVDDGALSITVIFGANNPMLSALEIILLAPHLAHSVPGGPYSAVDVDGDGHAVVHVDGSQSHTHAPGLRLATFQWTIEGNVVGTSEIDDFVLEIGTHDVFLRVVDSAGNESRGSTTIHVLGSEYPNIAMISPAMGSVDGGDLIRIHGSGFAEATNVWFGDDVISTFTVESDSSITLRSPSIRLAVPVSVAVEASPGISNPSTFTYVDNMPIAFDVRELLRTSNPTTVAFGPDRRLYVGSSDGKLTRVTMNDSFTKVVSTLVSEVSPGRFILGIAFDPLETELHNPNPTVYCSSSALFHGEEINSGGAAVNGKVHAVTGANMDMVTDIITGLPVSDHDHGVNGIQFGDKGELFILIGGNTNGGIPGKLSSTQNQRESFFSAAALVAHTGKAAFNGFITYDADVDGNPVSGYGSDGLEVFSSGLRSPFGVVLHSNGKLYSTDNGPNWNYGDMATGCGPGEQVSDIEKSDKLNLLVKDAYYGHPNHKRAEADRRQCVWEGVNHTKPILSLPSSAASIIEFASDHFGGQLRNNLIISKYKGGLLRVVLSNDGESVDPSSDPAILLGGDNSLSIAQAPNGVIVDARYISHKLYVFIPREDESSTSISNKAIIHSVFPRRGGLSGGSLLHVYGINFPAISTFTVAVGDKVCSHPMRLSEQELTCTLPGGKRGSTVDITVNFGDDMSTTFSKGYRYVKGVEQP